MGMLGELPDLTGPSAPSSDALPDIYKGSWVYAPDAPILLRR